jgi:hypothetical protein
MTGAVPVSLSLTDEDMPEVYDTADKGAIRSQWWYFFFVRIELIMISLAAFAEVAGRQWGASIANLLQLQDEGARVFGVSFTPDALAVTVASYILPAAVMIIAVLMFVLRVWLQYDRRWRGRRAIAEAAKELAWRYSMQAMHADLEASAPLSRPQADDAFRKELGDLITQSASLHLKAPTPDATQRSAKMSALRQAGDQVQRAAYLEGRLKNQQGWYARKAGVYQQVTTWLQVARFAAYAIGVILIFYHGLGTNGLGIMTTVAGAFATWLAGKHYDDLAQSYSGMARQLSLLDATASSVPPTGSAASGNSMDWAHFVNKVETLMDGEHQDWRRLS